MHMKIEALTFLHVIHDFLNICTYICLVEALINSKYILE